MLCHFLGQNSGKNKAQKKHTILKQTSLTIKIMAQKLVFQSSSPLYSPDDVAFDTKTGNLFAIRNYRVSTQPLVVTWEVLQMTTSGQVISKFDSSSNYPDFPNGIGISTLPNGNLLVLSPRGVRIAEFTTSGQLVSGGINFTSTNIVHSPTQQDPERRFLTGIFYDQATNTIFASDIQARKIVQLDTSGNLVSSINIDSFLPDTELQSITVDPLTGNFFLADDAPGNNNIYEITRAGQLVNVTDIFALTGISDPEGVTIDPSTRTMYMVFDEDAITGDREDEKGNRFAVFKLENDNSAPDPRSNDMLMGDAGANTLQGGFGNDTLLGSQGNDILSGGFGEDTLNGNAGNDTLSAGQGNDLVRGGQGDDLMSGSSGVDTLFGDLGNDMILGDTGNDIISGNAGNDTIYGGENNDQIDGGEGNDLLAGEEGNDNITGNAGDDIIKGNDGNDIVNGNEGDDLITGNAGNDTLNGGAGNDNIRGGRNDDIISGDQGADFLYGDLGNDTIIGGEGGDYLIGGEGNDFATGGGGRDSFVISPATGTDTISDFAVGQDLLVVTNNLAFGQLSITQGTGTQAQDALIRVAATGETLAVLVNVTASSLAANSFLTVQ